MKGIYFLIIALISTTVNDNLISATIGFKIKNMGMAVNGTMEVTDLQFKQLSADPSTWSLEGSASPATISTGIGMRDKHLKKRDYFDVEKFPQVKLQSSAIRAKGKDKYEGTFTLTIKDISKTVIIPFTISKNNNSQLVEGAFSINRLDFGLGEKSSILSDLVSIKVTGTFSASQKN